MKPRRRLKRKTSSHRELTRGCKAGPLDHEAAAWRVCRVCCGSDGRHAHSLPSMPCRSTDPGPVSIAALSCRSAQRSLNNSISFSLCRGANVLAVALPLLSTSGGCSALLACSAPDGLALKTLHYSCADFTDALCCLKAIATP